eukprot:GFYU01009542.1.p1 GENE.GFYU01009542.1~~GFYU01009542.1.p1  ORF type:complete len:384 (+),score=138.36 GFYU01009542.1:62-1153(+)
MADKTVWDTTTQTYHGGQDWKFCDNYVADFSVTTNGSAPQSGLDAAAKALHQIHHYPAADMEPAKTDLAKFLSPDNWEELHSRLQLGNGASELLDLVIRHAPEGGFKPGSRLNQYKEYERASRAMGRKILDFDSEEKPAVTTIINPNNPTGEWMTIDKLTKFIDERCPDGSTVIVDESMQPWYGPEWRSQSLLAMKDFIDRMYKERGVQIFLMHSWTKLWACPGLRLGSVLAPNKEIMDKIKKTQVPWSVNTMGLAFLSAVAKDDAYLKATWEQTTAWRNRELDFLKEHFPTWVVHGEAWLSWLWVDTGSEEMQKKVVAACKANGTPCRSGTPGYEFHTFVRFAVREPKEQDAFFKGLLTCKE